MINDENYIFTAVNLARMYGVAETLNDIPFMVEADFIAMMDAWTREYLLQEQSNIVAFFEEKIKQL